MKKLNGYWVDKNNNKWEVDFYTEKEAEKHSKSLVNCIECVNCIDCRDCIDCRNCRNCRDCEDCKDCIDCEDCRNCRDCEDCRNCIECIECIDCEDCIDCRNCIERIGCRGCVDCEDFKSNPQRITSPNLGSRDSQTTIYFNEEKTQVICGCFIGTLEEFKAKIHETHKDNEYAQGYFKWIERVEKYMEVEE